MRRQRWQRGPEFVIVVWCLFSSDSVFGPEIYIV